MKREIDEQSSREWDRQTRNLVHKGYPRAVGLTSQDFLKQIEPLQARISELRPPSELTAEGRVPFVIVVKTECVSAETALDLVEREGKTGFTVFDGDDLKRFTPIEGLVIPDGMAYLAVNMDRGEETRGVTPDDALRTTIDSQQRYPLTVDEGIGLITHYPDIVRKGHGFSLLGSRCGDRRVPALWISAGRPKLGWCWAGNPHTWLGSASCESRVGPPAT